MPKIRVDFSQAQEFEALPAGIYPVAVEETEIREGAKGPYINWTLKVVSGEYAGRKLWLTSSLALNAVWSLRANLRALGETSPDLDSDEFDMDPDDYLGREALATVSQETYNNRLQNRVDSLAPLDSAPSNGRRGRATAGIR